MGDASPGGDLVACATRAIIDAVFAPTGVGETTLAPEALAAARPGTLVLADRNFDAKGVMGAVRSAGGDFLTRAKTIRKLPVLDRTCRKAHIDIALLTGDPP
ncbi:MAG: transposase [Bifidobacteriaceae bacterium]|nr:transposase [Bifidobacteriaceae bacterium]